MRRIVIVLSIGLLAMSSFAGDEIPGAEQSAPVLLRGGDLYTVSDGVRPSTDLLFSNGKIEAIGRNLTAPEGTEIIDVEGMRVYPGLIGAQTTIGLIEISAVRATNDLDEVGDLTPEVTAHTAYNPDSEIIPTVRANGVTTIQVTPTGDLVRGRSFITHLDGWTVEDAGVVPIDGMSLQWPAVRPVHSWWVEKSEDEQLEEMAEHRRLLREFFDDATAYELAKEAGRNVETNVRLASMIPLLRDEIPLFVDADDYRQIVEAVAFAGEYGVDLVIVGGREAGKATELLRRRNIPVIVGATHALPMRQDDDYDQAFELPARLHEAGVKFCLSHPSSWATRNLALQAGQAVAFGLPAEVALRSITLSAAEILGIDDRQGSLEVGKDATLFVSEGDVMDMLGHRVTEMWIEGRRVDLDSRQKELYRKYREKIERMSE
ncbi:MAG: amidohydrolase family protein [Thermoanaerobaculia bacterium]|nr:amidohydrolase family protein [Thermoanaerobaculia bacterium]